VTFREDGSGKQPTERVNFLVVKMDFEESYYSPHPVVDVRVSREIIEDSAYVWVGILKQAG